MAAHYLHQNIHEPVHERLPQPQHIAVAHRTAQNTAQNVAAPFIREVHTLRK